MSDDDLIRSALRTEWHRIPTDITALPAGLMSRAWAVTVDGEHFVARLVDRTAHRPIEAGLAAAEHLRANGLQIGLPVRTLTGGLSVDTPDGTLSLLRRVPGRFLEGVDPVDQQWWGDRLGAAHRRLAGFDHPGLRRWNWLYPEAAHLTVEPWLRPAVADAVGAMIRLTVTDQLTYGVLHGDPAPSGFVVDPATGRAGLVDWGTCGTGPLVYDVAAAVVYAGGVERSAEFIDGYVAAGPVDRDEIDAALPVLLRFRWAVQADLIARRLSAAGVDPAADDGAAGEGRGAGSDRPALRRAREVLESMADDAAA